MLVKLPGQPLASGLAGNFNTIVVAAIANANAESKAPVQNMALLGERVEGSDCVYRSGDIKHVSRKLGIVPHA